MAPWDFVVNLPVGFKFHPRDDELLGYYLLNKVRGTAIKYDNVVPEVDLYGCTEPWDIWKDYGGQRLEKGEDLYFFTKLKRVKGKGKNMARTIGQGTWKGENSGTDVKDPNNRLLGSWKRYHYENEDSVEDGCWIMHEYSLKPSLVKPKSNSTTSDYGEYVLCRIRNNEKKRKVAALAKDHDQDDTTVQSHRNKIQRQSDKCDDNTSMSEVNYQYYDQQQQQITTTTGLNATDMPIDQPGYFVSNNSNTAVICSQYQQEFVPADHDDYVAQETSLPQPEYVEPNYDIDQLPQGFTCDLSEFLNGDGDALMKDFSFLDTSAHAKNDNNAAIQSFPAQPLGAHPYPCIQQAEVHEERTHDESHSQSLAYNSENIDFAPTDNNMGFGITKDQSVGQVGTDQNTELNASYFPFEDSALDVLKHGSFDDVLSWIQLV